MSDINLEEMQASDLRKLQKDVEAALKERRSSDLREARRVIEAKANAYGFTIEEIFPGLSKAKQPGPKRSAPKYRDPGNPHNYWSGKGRRPEWLKDALEKGAKLEDYLVS